MVGSRLGLVSSLKIHLLATLYQYVLLEMLYLTTWSTSKIRSHTHTQHTHTHNTHTHTHKHIHTCNAHTHAPRHKHAQCTHAHITHKHTHNVHTHTHTCKHKNKHMCSYIATQHIIQYFS